MVLFGKMVPGKILQIENSDYIAQTNHYGKTFAFASHNKTFYKSDAFEEEEWYWSDLLKNSQKRREMIDTIMNDLPTESDDIAEYILTQYCTPPLINFETTQRVVMRTKSMQMDIYKCVSRSSCPPDPSKVSGEGDMF